MPAMLDTVVKYQIGELLLVPPILIRMVRDKVVDEYDLSCVKRFSSGGESTLFPVQWLSGRTC